MLLLLAWAGARTSRAAQASEDETCTPPPEEAWTSKYAAMHGAALDHLTLTETKRKGRALLTTRAIHEDEDVLAIPLDACITSTSAAAHRGGPANVVLHGRVGDGAAGRARRVLLAALTESVDAAIALHILHVLNEKNATASQQWFKLIPGTIRTVMALAPTELEELQGSNVIAFREQVSAAWWSLHERVVVPLTKGDPGTFPPHAFAQTRFFWAMRAVWSRAVDASVVGSGGRTLRALCPLVDMINHDVARPVDAVVERGILKLINRGPPVLAGAEVSVSYGPRSSTATALVYGFVEDGNANDAVDILLETGASAAGTPLAARRDALLRRAGVLASASDNDAAALETPRLLVSGVDPLLVLTARIRVATAEELDDAEARANASPKGARALLDAPVWRAGTQNDARARVVLLDAIDALLRRYRGGGPDDDAAQLAVLGDADPGMALAIALRMSEKRVLHASLDHVRGAFSAKGAAAACRARFADDEARKRCKKLSKSGAPWPGPDAPRVDVKFRKDTTEARRASEGVGVRILGDGIGISQS